jgi:predicted RNA-binding Zn-ribbon protein involved in translation (DUF1610 family)
MAEREKYEYQINCSNCGTTSIAQQFFGRSRQVKEICPKCGCPADTSSKGPELRRRDEGVML